MSTEKHVSYLYTIGSPNSSAVYVGDSLSRDLEKVLHDMISVWEQGVDPDTISFSDCFQIFKAGHPFICLMGEPITWKTQAERNFDLYLWQTRWNCVNCPHDPCMDQILSDLATLDTYPSFERFEDTYPDIYADRYAACGCKECLDSASSLAAGEPRVLTLNKKYKPQVLTKAAR
jgi:hypothetical protein